MDGYLQNALYQVSSSINRGEGISERNGQVDFL